MMRRTEVINGELYRPTIYELSRGINVEVWDDFNNLYTAKVILFVSYPKNRILIDDGTLQHWVALNKIHKVV